MNNLIRILTGALCLFLLSCSGQQAEVERIAYKEMNSLKRKYVIALQTGEVKFSKTAHHPHILHPGSNCVELGFDQVYIVNAGSFEHLYPCRGCDVCMADYMKAGLIDYKVFQQNDTLTHAFVKLTPQGSKYLIQYYIDEYYHMLDAWRRREHLEIMLVATDEFKVKVKQTETPYLYQCIAYRYLKVLPFLKALGGTAKDAKMDYAYVFYIDMKDPGRPVVTRKKQVEPDSFYDKGIAPIW